MDRKQYLNEYKQQHYKRIPLDVTYDEYDEIKKAADAANESVNGFIKKAVTARLKSLISD